MKVERLKFLFGTSVLLIVCGVVIISVQSIILNYVTVKLLTLSSDTHTYRIWKKFPFPILMNLYLFNWTNPQDIYNTSIKPKFEQIGPYRFLENKEKVNVTWNNNGTVTFLQRRLWYYMDGTNNYKKDQIVTIDPIALTATYIARNWSYFMRKNLSFYISAMAPTVHITHTPAEWMTDGYSNTLLKTGQLFPYLSTKIPKWAKFGWAYDRNGSTDFEGVFNMGTGKNSTFGKLYNWNYKKDFTCGTFKGSAGEIFPRNLNKTSIRLFLADLCREITLQYVEETTVENLLGYKFSLGDETLDNGTIYPENKCFCYGECFPSGLLNISSCKYDSPTFVSLPHFYNGDPYYINSVDGLYPDKTKHEFSIVIEPTTGIPLEVKGRLQFNALMQPIPGIWVYENVPKIFLPILWLEQIIKLPSNEAFKIKLFLKAKVIIFSAAFTMIFIGLIIAIYIFYKIFVIENNNVNTVYNGKQKARKISMKYKKVLN